MRISSAAADFNSADLKDTTSHEVGRGVSFDSLKENGQAENWYKKTETNTYFYNTVGMIVASALGGLLYIYHIRLPYIAATMMAVLGLITAFFYQEPRVDTQKFTLKNYFRQNIDGTRHIFANPQIRMVSVFSIFVSFITYSALWFMYEPRLAAGNFTPHILAILVSGTYLMRALGTRLIPFMDKMLKPHQIPIFLAILQTTGTALSFIGGRLGAITTVYTRKFSDGFRYPILATLQNQEIDSKYRATSLSAINLFTSLLVGVMGILIGSSIDAFGIEKVFGAFTLIGIFIVIPLALGLSAIIKSQKAG